MSRSVIAGDSALSRLARRMEKRATDWSEVGADAAQGALLGTVPGALYGAFLGRHGGWRGVGQQALVNTITGAIPGALYSGLLSIVEQDARARALKEYLKNNGYADALQQE